MKCAICHEEIVQGPRPVDWTHAHGDVYCGTGDGAMATPAGDPELDDLLASFEASNNAAENP